MPSTSGVRCSRLPSLVLALVLGSASASEAAFTTEKCLALKLTAWGKLRTCQRAQEGKVVLGKPADLAKCQTAFQEKRAKVDAKALKAGVACRYRDNDDRTITDFDTGLMWEQKITTLLGGPCNIINPPSCVTRTETWFSALSAFIPELNGSVNLAAGSQAGHAGHSDWRLPSILELLTTYDPDRPACGIGGVCIDPILDPTSAGLYWSSTPDGGDSSRAFALSLVESGPSFAQKSSSFSVRAVRNAL